jgi:hypothetical protein
MKFAAGWGEVLIRGFTPPRLASRFARCSPTLPLQGRVIRALPDSPQKFNPSPWEND